MYPAVLLMYFISAAVILLASLALIVQVSLPCNKTERASVLYSFILVYIYIYIYIYVYIYIYTRIKVKWSHYRPGVAQRVGIGIALLFHDRGTRKGWVLSSTPWRTLPPAKNRYPFYRGLGVPHGRSGRAEKFRPHRDSIPDRHIYIYIYIYSFI